MLTSRVLRFWTFWQDRVAINPGFLLPLVGVMEIGISPLQRGEIHFHNLNKTNSYDGIQYGDNISIINTLWQDKSNGNLP